MVLAKELDKSLPARLKVELGKLLDFSVSRLQNRRPANCRWLMQDAFNSTANRSPAFSASIADSVRHSSSNVSRHADFSCARPIAVKGKHANVSTFATRQHRAGSIKAQFVFTVSLPMSFFGS